MGGISGFFLTVLNAIYSFVGDYGWSIVLFTLLVRMVLLPLDIKQKRNMRSMSAIQPKQAELQRKYGKDKEKYNQKLQELYKREKVSPFSGCLPMLIQLPLLWFMFAAMRNLANEHIVEMLLNIKAHLPADSTVVATSAQIMSAVESVQLQGWLWIKNVFQPDSFMSPILPAAQSALNGIRVVSGSSILTAENIEAVKAMLGTSNYALVAAEFGATDFVRIPLNLLFFNPTLTLPNSFKALITSANGLFILPLFAAISQFFMTKLTAGQQMQAPVADDQQAAGAMNMNSGFMKWFFPLFSLWICAGYNAAFAIYWAAVNVIQIATTYFINIYFERKDRQALPAEGRNDSGNSEA